jgi:RHH-type proline utilization regulon transcriptional repressor/proline dehydrogenase/delta 1-pyrroline-5-carboxylate dehydrogenase
LPRRLEDNPNLWSPGVKYGVQPGSFTHLTEFFGPVLGVMRFEKLAEAIARVNQTGYGLTAGLQSLDDREQEEWTRGVRAGNLYINRTTVGAVVLRQPFGGMGKSAFGPGLKAGGPNYVAQFMDFVDPTEPGPGESSADPLLVHLEERASRLTESDAPGLRADLARLSAAIRSYARNFREEFGRDHDHFRLVGQDNFRRYLPIRELRVRVDPRDSAFDIFARVCAARTVGCRITVSFPRDGRSPAIRLLEELTGTWAGAIELVEETDEELAAVVRDRETDRVRYAAPGRVPAVVRQAAGETGIHLATQPVLADGRVELLGYVQEQSLSCDYHRYGNLGRRADEARAEVR